LAGAVLKLRVVALAKVNAVVEVPSREALTSLCLMYSNVKEKFVVEPSPVKVF
jgi:hypothetical protein